MVRDDERNSSSPDELAPTSCPVNPAASAAASGDVTRILSAIEQGDGQAAELLLPVVYDELRKLAAVRMAQEKSGQTLQPTALVHEAHLRCNGPATFGGSTELGSAPAIRATENRWTTSAVGKRPY